MESKMPSLGEFLGKLLIQPADKYKNNSLSMKYNGTEVKRNTIISFFKDGEEYVGKVDYIRYSRYLRGDWGDYELDPLSENFKILRMYDGTLTHEGEVYNSTHPDRV